jgi:hypothetical protein
VSGISRSLEETPAGLQIVLDAGDAGGDDAENSAVNRTVVR